MRLVWLPLLLLLLLAATWVLPDYYSPSRRWTARRRLEELPLLEIVTRDRQDEDKLPFLQKVAFKQTWDRFKFTLMDSEIATDEKEDTTKLMRNNGYPVSRASPFKLQNCQSDCDSDKDCDQGLYCYQRERNSDPIPGCTFVTPEGSEDFCVAMPIPLSIVRPNHPVPSPSKPTRSPSMAPSTTDPTMTPTDIPTISPSTTLPTSTSPTWTPTTTPSATNAPSTACPSKDPTAATSSPSTRPSFSRVRTTLVPTAPTENPSMMPTLIPTTDIPSAHPTKDPTSFPSRSPSSFIVPITSAPTTDFPSTTNPSMMPVQTTELPSDTLPSNTPSTSPPSGVPTTSSPSTSPSSVVVDTTAPTTTVIPYDTSSPTTSPTTSAPSQMPTPSTQQPEGPVLPDAQYVGNNGSPLAAFPLQACQGDCDSDSDCSDGLVCYLRQDENEAIPGCLKRKHGGPAGTDFCVSLAGLLTSAPSTAHPSSSLTNAPSTAHPSSSPSWQYVQATWPPSDAPSTSPPSGFPTASRPSTSPSTLVQVVETPAPSSSPTTALPTERPTTSTPQPTEPSFPVAEYVGNDGSPSGAYPLQICQGDCDYDSDCNDGLVCYQRQEEEDPIPGCLNTGGQGGTDFCVLPIAPTSLPTTLPSTSPSPRPTTFSASTQPPTETKPALPDAEYVGNDGSPSEAYPLQACQGDCDSDSDCSSGLLCYEREDENDPIPGCQNTAHGGPAGTDFCIPPAAPTSNDGFPAATIVGNGDFDESNYPLKMCQGDCDEDWDCEFPLICYQRSRSSDPIPGCSFDRGLVKTSDFCVPSQADDGSNKILEGAFRLRLYWEEGYVWQESTIESFWCASMNYNKDTCWYGRIGKRCRSDHMYLTRCGGTSVKPEDQAFIFVPLDDDQVLIQSANREDLRCWERSRRELLLRTCDPNNPLQRWIATDGTSFFDPDDNRFEISQIGYEKQCVSNDHHPKEAEAVELHSCIYNKDPESQTAYWERF